MMNTAFPDNVASELQSFAECIGLDTLEADETGYFAIESDRGEVIHFQWKEETGAGFLELSTTVGKLADKQPSDGLRLLLEANFSRHGSHSGAFALYPGSDDVWYLSTLDSSRVTAAVLEAALVHCFEVLSAWREQLAGSGQVSGDVADLPMDMRA